MKQLDQGRLIRGLVGQQGDGQARWFVECQKFDILINHGYWPKLAGLLGG